MLTIYGAPNTRSLRILWLLEELAVSYQYHQINFMKGESRTPEYLAINPSGKVPVMREDDLVLTESAAILTYLADKHAGDNLIPTPKSAERAKYDEICYFAMTELEAPLWLMAKHKFALPKDKRIADIFPTASWEYEKACKLLSIKLAENSYVLGNEFSVADILVAQTLLWGESFKQTVSHDNLQKYLERIKTRPALLAAKAKESASI